MLAATAQVRGGGLLLSGSPHTTEELALLPSAAAHSTNPSAYVVTWGFRTPLGGVGDPRGSFPKRFLSFPKRTIFLPGPPLERPQSF